MHSPKLRAPTPAGSSDCTMLEHALHFARSDLDLRQQAQAHVLERVLQIAIVGNGVADDAGNRNVDGGQLGEFQLLDELLLQRLAVLVAEITAAIVIAGPGSVGRPAGLLAPRLVGNFDLRSFALLRRRADAVQRGIFLIQPNRQFFAVAHRIGHLGLVLALEHHIGLERLAHMGLQVERRQLQQPDRLLQLRGHGQLLTDAKLQTWLQHISFRPNL